MSRNAPSRRTIKAATDAVVEYALLSIEPRFQCWEKDVNLQVAEFVWNAGGRNLNPSVFHAPGGDLSELVAVLCRARRTRWPDEEVLLVDLDSHVERGEIVFTFDLSWDEGRTFQACRIVVDFAEGTPAERN